MPPIDTGDVPTANRPVLPTALVRSASGQTSAPHATARQGRHDASTPTSFALIGKRTDQPEGAGLRLRIGLDVTGTAMIVERWSEAGVRTSVAFS